MSCEYLRDVSAAEMTDVKPVNITHSLKTIVLNMTAEHEFLLITRTKIFFRYGITRKTQ